jgi:hypothetical protein
MAHTQPQSKKALDDAIAKGYEPSDLKLRAVFVFVGVLALTLVVVLSAMYAIMVAMFEHGKTEDPQRSPVVIKSMPVYAPLQPSLGFNGDHENDHDVLDEDDMLMMRQKVQQELAASGISSTGRRYISIDEAIDLVAGKHMLPVKPVVKPVVQPPNPPDSWEGYTPNIGIASDAK